MFDKAKMMAKALKLKKAIEKLTVKEEDGGIEVIATGSQKIKSIKIDGQERKDVTDVVNKALKRSQEVAAREMKEMGGLEGLL